MCSVAPQNENWTVNIIPLCGTSKCVSTTVYYYDEQKKKEMSRTFDIARCGEKAYKSLLRILARQKLLGDLKSNATG
jgi:hypothetical protein